MAKTLIICSDGTWQNLSDDEPTNVVRIAEALLPNDGNGNPQIVYYDAGIGARDDGDDSKKEGATGAGINTNIRELYRFICFNYCEDDRLVFVGFSRGSYTVRSVAGLIATCGVLSRDKIRFVPEALAHYRRRDDDAAGAALSFKNINGCFEPKIEALACFDTVGSLGIPDLTPWFGFDDDVNDRHRFHNTDLSSSIKKAFHAQAIDEQRVSFINTPMIASTQGQLEQRWFIGDHGSVGGGTRKTRGLAYNTCAWMMDRLESCGVAFDKTYVGKIEAGIDHTNDFSQRKSPIYSFQDMFHGNPWRQIGDLETIDGDVIKRAKADKDYRPDNLFKREDGSQHPDVADI